MRVPLPARLIAALLVLAAVLTGSLRLRATQPAGPPSPAPPVASRPPNIILILADDLGYGDLGSYGSPVIRTPHLDALDRDGFRATSAYAPSPSCSPTRASILTGRYAHRVGIRAPLSPRSPIGLRADAHVTLPQLLRGRGYRTMLVGKWHLGDQPGTRPTDHAFDRFVGMLYSHDYTDPWVATDERLALYDGTRRRIEQPDPSTLTQTYTAEARTFIRDSGAARQPFFLYLAHAMPHVPLAVASGDRRTTSASLYAAVVEALDDSVGEIRAELAATGQASNTIVIFTSDNGPWNAMPDRMFGRDLVKPWDHGSTGPFRGGKATTYEGGHRVPFIAAWPSRLAPRVSDVPISLVDLLPTLASVAGATASVPRDLDGIDIGPVLTGAAAPADRVLLYDHLGRAEAVRVGAWKLRLTYPVDGAAGVTELFHLLRDPGERHDVARAEPGIVAKLRRHLPPSP